MSKKPVDGDTAGTPEDVSGRPARLRHLTHLPPTGSRPPGRQIAGTPGCSA